MRKDTFLHEIKGSSCEFGDWTLWSKPTVLENRMTGEEIKYKNVAEAYEKAIVDGKPLKEIVAAMEVKDMYSNGINTIDDSDIMVFKDLFPEDFE